MTQYHIISTEYDHYLMDSDLDEQGAIAQFYAAQYPNREIDFEDSGTSNGAYWVTDGNETFWIARDRDCLAKAFFDLMFCGPEPFNLAS